MERFKKIISGLNDKIGIAVSYLLVLMIASTCYEVGARYFFNRPTIWSLEINTYLMCTYSLLGGGFALLRNGHVSVDILFSRLNFRTQAILNCLTSFFFFIFVGILLAYGWKMSYESIRYQETSGTIMNWPLFPSKFMVPMGAVLLLLQGLVKLLNDGLVAFAGKPPEEGTTPGGIFGGAHK